MSFNDAVEEAKRNLSINGWCNKYEWDEVIDEAKKLYWENEDFKDLKEDTISSADGKCELCNSKLQLTAHHITYGNNEETICLCKKCHKLVHSPSFSRYGFVLQLLLSNISNKKYDIEEFIPDGISNVYYKVKKELLDKVIIIEEKKSVIGEFLHKKEIEKLNKLDYYL